jgi:hypothetical protein
MLLGAVTSALFGPRREVGWVAVRVLVNMGTLKARTRPPEDRRRTAFSSGRLLI